MLMSSVLKIFSRTNISSLFTKGILLGERNKYQDSFRTFMKVCVLVTSIFMLEVLLFSKEVMENWKLLMGSRDLQCFQYFQAY